MSSDSASDRGLASATKATKDSETEERHEAAGIITSDSLAGESMKNDGDFGKDNPRAAAMEQLSHGTTTNNEDTSAATTLPPAPQASARDSVIEGSGSSESNASKSQGKDTGDGPTYATVASGAAEREQGSETSQGQDRTSDQTQDSSVGQDETSVEFADDGENGARAPSYVNAAALLEAEQKPKGKNLKEGGIDDDAKNASFDGEIGTDDDPGRLAERKFEGFGTEAGADAGEGQKESNVTGENTQYGALEDTEA